MAGGKTIGRLSIKVSPDLGGFSSELKRRLKADNSEAEVPVSPDLTGFSKELKSRLKALDEDFEVRVRPVLDRSSLASVRRQLEQAFRDEAVKVSARLDRSSAAQVQRDLEGMDARVPVTPYLRRLQEIQERLNRIVANVDVDLDNASVQRSRAEAQRMLENVTAQIQAEIDRSSLEHAKSQMSGIEETATLNVDLDRGVARAQLALLARDRIVKLRPVVDGAAAAAARAALDGLARTSGAHALSEWGREVRRFMRDLDQIAPKAGIVSTSLFTLGSAFTALAGHTAAVVTGLVQMTPALLTLPALALGAVTGIGVMVVALRDARDVLGDLGPAWTRLGQSISSSFWERAAQPIRDLSNRVMPTLSRQLPRLASGFGAWAASMAGVLGSTEGIRHINELMGNMVTATNRALPGVTSLTRGLLALSSVGSRYMPRMADAFNRAAASFERWASGAEGAERIETAINKAVAAAKAMWTIFASLGSVLASVGRAAGAAGYSLDDTARKMQALADAMKSVTAQSIMIGLFTAARGTMAAFGAQLQGTGMALDRFANTLARVGPLAGEASGNLARMGIEILGDPNFGAGLYRFFDGVRSGTEALRQASPAIALVVGKVLELGGAFAQIAGQNIATIFEQWGPIFADIMTHLEPLVQKLGVDLNNAITTLTPILQWLADNIVIPMIDWLATTDVNLIAVAASLMAVVGAFRLITGLVSVIETLQGIGSAFSFISSILGVGGGGAAAGGAAGGGGGLLGGLTGASSGFLGLGASAGVASGILVGVVAVIATVAAAIWDLWQNNDEFRTNVTNAWNDVKTAIGNAVNAVVTWWNNDMKPAVDELWQAVKRAWEVFGRPTFETVKSVILSLSRQWTSIWNGVKLVFQGVWTAISGILKGAVSIMTGILNVFTGLFTGNWSLLWKGVQQIFVGSWNAVTAIFRGGAQILFGIARIIGSTMLGVFRGLWNMVPSVFRNGITAAVNVVRSVGSTLFNIGKNILSRFVNGIKSSFSAVRNVFSNLTSMIPSWKGPEQRDRHLLDGPAKWIMEGFADSLEKASTAPKGVLQQITDDIQTGVSLADMEISGADVMIVNNYPKEQTESSQRNQVAQAIRLASI